MSPEIKYTTDGRKVVVIGDLNQTEKIVQEIFVTDDGVEIPSGERFVVKSLLDAPAKTWKQKELEELEQRYEKERKEWDIKFIKLEQEKTIAYSALSERVQWLKNIAKESHQQQLKDAITRIADFLSNNNKWIVVNTYDRYTLEPFNDEGINILDSIDYSNGYSYRKHHSMRLLSLYGKCDGNLEFRVNRYSDGSGLDTEVMFFSNKKSALDFMQNKIDSLEKYTTSTIEMASEYGLCLNPEKLEIYKQERKETFTKRIFEAEQKLAQCKKDLEKFNSENE